MRYLAAVDTVHTAAAICDYLQGRVREADEVHAVAVHPPPTAEATDDGEDADARDEGPDDREHGGGRQAPGSAGPAGSERDRQEALNVVSVRLLAPAVETGERTGAPARELLAAAEERAVDELVVGDRSGTPGAPEGVGSTARAVLERASAPVVVVPLAEL